MDLVHILTPHFFKINFNNILPSTSLITTYVFNTGFRNWKFVPICLPAKCPTNQNVFSFAPNPFIFITRTIDFKNICSEFCANELTWAASSDALCVWWIVGNCAVIGTFLSTGVSHFFLSRILNWDFRENCARGCAVDPPTAADWLESLAARGSLGFGGASVWNICSSTVLLQWLIQKQPQ